VTGPVTAEAIVAGVVGAPVRHSLSPLIHNAWIAAAGLDAAYVAFAVADGRFEAFCDGLRGGALRGVNVTAPFKEAALALADDVSARALAAGSANLLTFELDGRIFADSTDGEGLLRGLADQAVGFAPDAGPAVILGAGGAARAAAAALLQAGCPQVVLANRSPARAAQVAAFLGAGAHAVDEALTGVDLGRAALIVNATPVGLGGGPGPVLDLGRLGARTVVMDMIYRPLRTSLLEAAAARGLRTVDGLAMLIGQAVPSFTRLFGREPPAIDVRRLAEASC
jgi:shikimate dehydrogenase